MIRDPVILKCKLINEIVCNRIKTSLVDSKNGLNVPVKAATQEVEVIEIIDDEPETSSVSPKVKLTEIIVLDDMTSIREKTVGQL
ncbi:hypothetical protein DPMN_041738 [Dreissena polymorpha]|uniref:Uncharacterized protein n=1 Tax=Dreissena polymorpha TaxID=45954 RepID=A0A9D4D0S9_DREPO|nr:hypothetical protein DPMN_041738 [Dreissena polymorpha]